MLRRCIYFLFKPTAPTISKTELTQVKTVIKNGLNTNNLKIYGQSLAGEKFITKINQTEDAQGLLDVINKTSVKILEHTDIYSHLYHSIHTNQSIKWESIKAGVDESERIAKKESSVDCKSMFG